MDNTMDDKVIMDFYNRRRVTRSQFEEFLQNSEDTRPFCRLLQDHIPEEQREALFKTGDSVCRIDIDGNPEGTGFHLGGGWILTNQHVIFCTDEEESSASNASFIFPHKTIEPAPRNVIFSYFQDPVGTTAVHDSRKDLALILVEEISSVTGLTNIFQKPPKEGDRVILIHYGDGVKDKRNPPQQFSISDNEVIFSAENEYGNRFSVHTAHSRRGSSGAPLLVFNETLQKFRVAAVHYAGPELAKMIDSPGFALLYANNEWLQCTVMVASMVTRICQQSDPTSTLKAMSNCGIKATLCDDYLKMCKDLEQHLKKHSLRIKLAVKLPECIDFNSETVIFTQ